MQVRSSCSFNNVNITLNANYKKISYSKFKIYNVDCSNFDLYSHQVVLLLEERKNTINQSVYIALAGWVVCLYFKTFKQSKSNKSNIFCSFNTIQIKVKTNKPQDNLKMIIMSS